MMLIKREILDKIIAHSINELPNEACGYLASGNGIITTNYNLSNVDQSPEHYSFDPAEQFSCIREARKSGLQVIANYHSHPKTPARPSEEDIRLAYDPEIIHFIISLAGIVPVVKAYRIKDSKVEAEEITIVE